MDIIRLHLIHISFPDIDAQVVLLYCPPIRFSIYCFHMVLTDIVSNELINLFLYFVRPGMNSDLCISLL